MAHSSEDPTIAHPEVLTLHWEGPPRVTLPVEPDLGDAEDARAQRERELRELRRSQQGRALWEQIRGEAARKGDIELWERRLHAYWWVKLEFCGSAGDYARRFATNHATVRTWIAEVAKLAYQVGYRLHEDKLLLVGEAPEGLRRLREQVNADAASPQALSELRAVEDEFRGQDPYFHLNEGHVLRARGDLRGSDATLQEGLSIAEAPRVRSMLWNARGQTLWDCDPDSSHPLPDHLALAEKAFRRATALDQSTWFPFVNLAQMAVEAGDAKRAEYWIGELSAARKGMDEAMRDGLVQYLEQAEWTSSLEGRRFWKQGPAKWLREAAAPVALALAALCLCFALAAPPATASPSLGGASDASSSAAPPTGTCGNSGAGGN